MTAASTKNPPSAPTGVVGTVRLAHFDQWLAASASTGGDGRYAHQLLKERVENRAELLPELKDLVSRAHEDTRRYLQAAATPLDPLSAPATFDPAAGYPSVFHIQTLKGYFGEIFSGIVAENLAPFGLDGWTVPAFLFRFHDAELLQLELLRQTGGTAKKRPGRLGDDCIAFRKDGDDVVRWVLDCEAKCTADHDSALIAEAHEKISERNLLPLDLRRVIEVLRDYSDPDSRAWLRHLQKLFFETPTDFERIDLVCYVCGKSPQKGDRTAWMSQSTPHTKYTGKRRLIAVEVHIYAVQSLISEVYGKEVPCAG